LAHGALIGYFDERKHLIPEKSVFPSIVEISKKFGIQPLSATKVLFGEENEGVDDFMDRFCEFEDLRTDNEGEFVDEKMRRKIQKELERQQIVNKKPFFLKDWPSQYEQLGQPQVYYYDGGRDQNGQFPISQTYFANQHQDYQGNYQGDYQQQYHQEDYQGGYQSGYQDGRRYQQPEYVPTNFSYYETVYNRYNDPYYLQNQPVPGAYFELPFNYRSDYYQQPQDLQQPEAVEGEVQNYPEEVEVVEEGERQAQASYHNSESSQPPQNPQDRKKPQRPEIPQRLQNDNQSYQRNNYRRCENKIIQGSCRCANCLYNRYFMSSQ